jgi:hypothetical protein
VRIEALIRLTDQFPIEPLLAHARFVASDKKDCLPPGIERERYPPLSISGGEAQFLPIGVA